MKGGKKGKKGSKNYGRKVGMTDRKLEKNRKKSLFIAKTRNEARK